MSGIQYLIGDATAPKGPGPKFIAHICNDMGGWGKGFVLAISNRWREPEREYRRWYTERAANDFALGAVQRVQVLDDLWVANMIGQHGIRATEEGPPIRYDAVEQCLSGLGDEALKLNASVHMPRIGCGLAGGSWEVIGPLIESQLVTRGVSVTVYDLARPIA